MTALWIARIVEVYAIAGVVFSAAFAIRGVGAVDPVARGAGVLFRLLLVPGAVLLWPLLAIRWRRT